MLTIKDIYTVCIDFYLKIPLYQWFHTFVTPSHTFFLTLSINLNPLITSKNVCPKIFCPRRSCSYWIAPKRLKIWKKNATTFCSSWNCASNKPNYRSIAIVVPKIHAVKVSRRLSKKTRKSQNLIVFKGLTWPQISKFFSKNHQISPNISFLAQKLTKKHILGQFEIFHTSVLTLCER